MIRAAQRRQITTRGIRCPPVPPNRSGRKPRGREGLGSLRHGVPCTVRPREPDGAGLTALPHPMAPRSHRRSENAVPCGRRSARLSADATTPFVAARRAPFACCNASNAAFISDLGSSENETCRQPVRRRRFDVLALKIAVGSAPGSPRRRCYIQMQHATVAGTRSDDVPARRPRNSGRGN